MYAVAHLGDEAVAFAGVRRLAMRRSDEAGGSWVLEVTYADMAGEVLVQPDGFVDGDSVRLFAADGAAFYDLVYAAGSGFGDDDDDPEREPEPEEAGVVDLDAERARRTGT